MCKKRQIYIRFLKSVQECAGAARSAPRGDMFATQTRYSLVSLGSICSLRSLDMFAPHSAANARSCDTLNGQTPGYLLLSFATVYGCKHIELAPRAISRTWLSAAFISSRRRRHIDAARSAPRVRSCFALYQQARRGDLRSPASKGIKPFNGGRSRNAPTNKKGDLRSKSTSIIHYSFLLHGDSQVRAPVIEND